MQKLKTEIKVKEATIDKVKNKNYEKKNDLLIKMALFKKSTDRIDNETSITRYVTVIE